MCRAIREEVGFIAGRNCSSVKLVSDEETSKRPFADGRLRMGWCLHRQCSVGPRAKDSSGSMECSQSMQTNGKRAMDGWVLAWKPMLWNANPTSISARLFACRRLAGARMTIAGPSTSAKPMSRDRQLAPIPFGFISVALSFGSLPSGARSLPPLFPFQDDGSSQDTMHVLFTPLPGVLPEPRIIRAPGET